MRSESIHLGDDVLHVAGQHTLGEFKHEVVWVSTSASEGGKDMFDEIRLTKLPCADIHSDLNAGQNLAIGPSRNLHARRFEDQVAQWQDESGFLGQWNELVGGTIPRAGCFQRMSASAPIKPVEST